MDKDRDLERIKAGNGLANSSTQGSSNQSSGTVSEQRGGASGVRYEIFTRQETAKGSK